MSEITRKKKAIIAVVACAMVLVVGVTVFLTLYFTGVIGSPEYNYNDFDDFITRNNIAIPDGFSSRESAEDFYVWVMENLQKNPKCNFAFGWLDYEIFALRIQIAYLNENHIVPTLSMKKTLNILEAQCGK